MTTVGSQDTTGPMTRDELKDLACLGFSADLVMQSFCHTAAYPKPADVKMHKALPDYELLELILFRAIPRQDVKPLARRLLERLAAASGIDTSSYAGYLAALKEIRGSGTREAASPKRLLVTVLFTDIVTSTELAASLGDRHALVAGIHSALGR